MKTKLILSAICIVSLSSLFVACSDDDNDTTKPVIVINEPEDEGAIKTGSLLHLDMDLSDDVMVASYKVDIHNNFDGHTHTSASTKADGDSITFTYNQSFDVNQKNHHVHDHIEIPILARQGKYHVVVYCTDTSGNESYVAKSVVFDANAEEDVD